MQIIHRREKAIEKAIRGDQNPPTSVELKKKMNKKKRKKKKIISKDMKLIKTILNRRKKKY